MSPYTNNRSTMDNRYNVSGENYNRYLLLALGTAAAQWLRCCATNRKVAGSIPAGVIGYLLIQNHTDRTLALGSTQPVTEMSTRSISWG